MPMANLPSPLNNSYPYFRHPDPEETEKEAKSGLSFLLQPP